MGQLSVAKKGRRDARGEKASNAAKKGEAWLGRYDANDGDGDPRSGHKKVGI